MKLSFDVDSLGGTYPLDVSVENLYIIGYGCRNIDAIRKHIVELENIGIPGPKSIPEYYRNSSSLLTQDDEIQVVGNGSSGEVEFIILYANNDIYIGVGSDHTDRDLEAVDIPKAKNVCPKPIGKRLWRYQEVKDHWDSLGLKSWQVINGSKELYQEGSAADLLPLDIAIDGLKKSITGNLENSLVFTGTVATIGGIRKGNCFYGTIEDKLLGRSLDLQYAIKFL